MFGKLPFTLRWYNSSTSTFTVSQIITFKRQKNHSRIPVHGGIWTIWTLNCKTYSGLWSRTLMTCFSGARYCQSSIPRHRTCRSSHKPTRRTRQTSTASLCWSRVSLLQLFSLYSLCTSGFSEDKRYVHWNRLAKKCLVPRCLVALSICMKNSDWLVNTDWASKKDFVFL